MDLYKQLGLTPVRSEPDVWISRLVIFEKLLPQPVIIRDIALSQGLNIVWAEEPEDDNPASEISGHSAGKTTFCRFLRYVLGERTFGTPVATDLIRKAIPEGYVAGEIHVRGTKWAVRRPFGGGRMTYVMQNATIEEMLEGRSEAVSQDDYPRTLGIEGILDALETGTIVRTDETIHWGHVLAWCSRDQETRFQNVHDWRSPRSGSEAPGFQRPKEGPLFVMRAVMGLFLPDELKGEEKLASLRREKERLERQVEEKRREPHFWVNRYDRELRQCLAAHLPNDLSISSAPLHSDGVFPDLCRLTDRVASEIERSIRCREELLGDVQARLDVLGASTKQREDELHAMEALFDLNLAAGKEIDQGRTLRQEQQQQLTELQDSVCPFGGVVIRECSHVRDRQAVVRLTELRDIHAMEQAGAARIEEERKIEQAKLKLRDSIQQLQAERSDCIEKRRGMSKALAEEAQALRDLRRARETLETWTQRRDQGVGYEELASLSRKLDDTTREIESLEAELTKLLRQHDENLERLANIFSGAVRSVLSSEGYDGVVNLNNRELAFRITHGPAMSGEAVETLSVLLADVASLIYHTVSDKAHLPGILVHDSPREADLGLRIYKGFIRFVASLQTHCGGADRCPFQYILTTTTAPPKELREPGFLKLRLTAAKAEGLLLKRNVAAPPKDDEPELFSLDRT